MNLILLISLSLLYPNKDSSIQGHYEELNHSLLCSSSYDLVIIGNDSLYYYESGCEASSHIDFGKFSTRDNKIKFIPQELPTYLLGFRVDTLDKGGINFSVKDIQAKNVSAQEIDIYPSKDKNFFGGYLTNDSGFIYTKLDSLSAFRIAIPYKFKEEWEWIDFKINTPCIITIFLSMPRRFYMYPSVRLNDKITYELIMEKNGLVSKNPNEIIYRKTVDQTY